jgi:hypothetical protein
VSCNQPDRDEGVQQEISPPTGYRVEYIPQTGFIYYHYRNDETGADAAGDLITAAQLRGQQDLKRLILFTF